MGPVTAEADHRSAEHVARSLSIREEFGDAGIEIDRLGTDPTEIMDRCWELGLFNLSLPAEFGGDSTGEMAFAVHSLYRSIVNISAIDGSAGQCYATQHFSLRRHLASADLPRSTKEQLVAEFGEKCIRFVSSNSEAGTGPVLGKRVDGGIRVSGTKSFNTNSGADGYASVSFHMEDGERRQGLVRLDAEGVTQLGDWEVMGQRGTVSQSIVYDDVFVADGWHTPFRSRSARTAARGFGVQAALMVGIAAGALDAAIRFTRKLDRPTMSRFDSAAEDPLIHLRVGRLSTRVHAGLALLDRLADEVVALGDSEDGDAHSMEIVASAFRTKMACVDAALEVSSDMFELLGARSVARSRGFDRFWRNARTFALHDPSDAKYVAIGMWELNGEWPDGVLPHGGVGIV